MKIVRWIFNSCKVGQWLMTVFAFSIIMIGYILWFISRPLVALSYLFMGKPHTAWEELTDTNPRFSFKDI